LNKVVPWLVHLSQPENAPLTVFASVHVRHRRKMRRISESIGSAEHMVQHNDRVWRSERNTHTTRQDTAEATERNRNMVGFGRTPSCHFGERDSVCILLPPVYSRAHEVDPENNSFSLQAKIKGTWTAPSELSYDMNPFTCFIPSSNPSITCGHIMFRTSFDLNCWFRG
jgi:hypothetical protein